MSATTAPAKRRHKRSPNGYHIEQWLDGTFHAYFGGECLDECQTRREALDEVWGHYEARKQMAALLPQVARTQP